MEKRELQWQRRADLTSFSWIFSYRSSTAMRRPVGIKANPELRHIPIIAVTSYALSGDDAKALAAGCDGYFAKPFSPRVILAKVHEFLA